jgi:hypothetical protein
MGLLSRELEYADGHDTGVAAACEGIVVGQEAGTQTLAFSFGDFPST